MKLFKFIIENANDFLAREGVFATVPFLLVLVASQGYPYFIDGLNYFAGVSFSLVVISVLFLVLLAVLHQRKGVAEVASILLIMAATGIALTFWIPLILIFGFGLAWFVAIECHNGKISCDPFTKTTAMFIPLIPLFAAVIKFDYAADFVIYWFIGMVCCAIVNSTRKPSDVSEFHKQ